VILVIAVGLAWLLSAGVVAVVIGRAIRLADASSAPSAALDRFLVECSRELDLDQASSGSRGLPRTA
jgi:hypothetical protein